MDAIVDKDALLRSSVSPDAAHSRTLPGWAYTDPNVFEQEKENIFFKTWQYAGSVHQLKNKGDYITADLLGQSVIVMRGRDGVIRGFHNVCQHRGHQLLSGCGNKQAIVCPYHAWGYQTDGQLVAARGTENMQDFDKSLYGLKPVRVEVFADHFVFYNLDPEAVPLVEQTGGLAGEMREKVLHFDKLEFGGAMSGIPGDVKANWKIMVDNYLECYHCKVAHPAFSDLLDMNFESTSHGNWTHQKSGMGRRDNCAYAIGENEENDRALFWWVFPNTTFNVVPGDPAHLLITIYQPIEPGKTLAWSHMYGEAGKPPNEARNEWLANVVAVEDNDLCESVQRGLHSKGYTAGRIVFDPKGGEVTEEMVHTFHLMVTKTLGL